MSRRIVWTLESAWFRVSEKLLIGNDCWEFQNIKDKDGYGSVTLNGRSVRAHRIALEWSLGRKILLGLQALHNCGNSSCCRPDHLREGTQAENEQDKKLHGTWDRPGRPPRLSLDDVELARVFWALGYKQHQIASALGCSRAYVSELVNGHSRKGRV